MFVITLCPYSTSSLPPPWSLPHPNSPSFCFHVTCALHSSSEAVSHYVAQVGFELRYSSLHPPNAWIMGICDHIQQNISSLIVSGTLI